MTDIQKALAAAELISKAVKILRGIDGDEIELARKYANRARRTIEKTAFGHEDKKKKNSETP